MSIKLSEIASLQSGASTGFTGSRGFNGFTGSQGFVGSSGLGISILGSVADEPSLPLGAQLGDAYLIGNNLWVWDSVEWTGGTPIIGYTGSQGIPGPIGNIGFTGSAGFTGSQGIQGIQGIQGFTGSQGIQGIQGIQGTGFTGSKGDQGEIGFTGSRGSFGYTGSRGIVGSTGFTGSIGFSGSAGFTGSQGLQGIRGFTGSSSEDAVFLTGDQTISGLKSFSKIALGSGLLSDLAFRFTSESQTGFYSSDLGTIDLVTLGSAKIRVDDRLRIGITFSSTPGENNSNTGISLLTSGQSYQSSTSLTTLTLNRNTTDGSIVSFRRQGTQVGTIAVTTSETFYNTTSDYRLKTNLRPINDAVSTVIDLPVYRFDWKNNPSKTSEGFIAHELQQYIPGAVTGNKDEVDEKGQPIFQSVDYSKVVPVLTAALKEALIRIELLIEEVNNLKRQ